MGEKLGVERVLVPEIVGWEMYLGCIRMDIGTKVASKATRLLEQIQDLKNNSDIWE